MNQAINKLRDLPGQSMKCQYEQRADEFLGGGNGPSTPPCIHWPKPVREPSSHQPQPGSMWQSRHDFIPEHWRPNNVRGFLCYHPSNKPITAVFN